MSEDGTDNLSNLALVIGVGNEFRHDDGVGIEIARRIEALSLPRVLVTTHYGEGASLMEFFGNHDFVIIVDASQTGTTPGTIVCFDASKSQVPSDFFNYSTHAFSVAEAVELARAMNRLPERLIIYGIEGNDFSMGMGLSEAVQSAIDDVVDKIECDLKTFLLQAPA